MGRIGRAIGRGVPDLGVEDGDSETPSPGFEEFSRETCYSLLCRVDQEGGCMVPEGSGSRGVVDLPDLSRSDLQLLAVGVGVRWKASTRTAFLREFVIVSVFPCLVFRCVFILIPFLHLFCSFGNQGP